MNVFSNGNESRRIHFLRVNGSSRKSDGIPACHHFARNIVNPRGKFMYFGTTSRKSHFWSPKSRVLEYHVPEFLVFLGHGDKNTSLGEPRLFSEYHPKKHSKQQCSYANWRMHWNIAFPTKSWKDIWVGMIFFAKMISAEIVIQKRSAQRSGLT